MVKIDEINICCVVIGTENIWVFGQVEVHVEANPVEVNFGKVIIDITLGRSEKSAPFFILR